jgi:hypothetical protein
LESAVNVINNLSKEHTAAINDDVLGISRLDQDEDLSTIVKPRTYKIKETKGDNRLCYEDPLSSTE